MENLLLVSKELQNLSSSGDLWMAIWETVYMTVISLALAYVIGLPLGVILTVTDKNGLCKNLVVNKTLGIVVNILRSIPFVILMVTLLPVANFLLGKSVGNGPMIVMLTIAAAPYVARMVESSLKEVNKGVIEAARALGASNSQIIFKVLLPEAKPALLVGLVISAVTVLGYSAMASTIGGGGLGKIAIINGHQRQNKDVMWVALALSMVIVQVIQELGMLIAKRTDKRIHHIGKKKKNKKENTL